jgi:hypothetical protein
MTIAFAVVLVGLTLTVLLGFRRQRFLEEDPLK